MGYGIPLSDHPDRSKPPEDHRARAETSTINEKTIADFNDTDPWEWSCGFYPGSHPGEHRSNTIATFEEARADFERAWLVFLSNRTDTDFQAWRGERDWTERKYALWDAGKRLEPPSYGPGKPCSRFMKCPCGEVFDMRGPDAVLMHVPHITVISNAL